MLDVYTALQCAQFHSVPESGQPVSHRQRCQHCCKGAPLTAAMPCSSFVHLYAYVYVFDVCTFIYPTIVSTASITAMANTPGSPLVPCKHLPSCTAVLTFCPLKGPVRGCLVASDRHAHEHFRQGKRCNVQSRGITYTPSAWRSMALAGDSRPSAA